MKQERIEELLAATLYKAPREYDCAGDPENDAAKHLECDKEINAARVQLLAKALREAKYWLTDGAIPSGEVMADGVELKWPDSLSAIETIDQALAEAGLDKEPA
jgi:hypothetical protein